MNFIIRFANVQQRCSCAAGVAVSVALNEGRPRQRSAHRTLGNVECNARRFAANNKNNNMSRGNSNKNNRKWNCYAHYMTALPASQSDNSKRQQQRQQQLQHELRQKKSPSDNRQWQKVCDRSVLCALSLYLPISLSASLSLSRTFVQVGGGSALMVWWDNAIYSICEI